MAAKAHWGYPRALLDGWRTELAVSAADIRSKPTFVAIVEQELAGFYSLKRSDSSSWRLDSLWVLPRFMSQRIGRALLKHALETASRHGATEVTVDADPNAESFYVACGAERRGQIAAPIPGHKDRARPQLSFRLAARAPAR